MMTEKDILNVLNRLAVEKPQLNFDSEYARAQIARIIYFENTNKTNAQLAKGDAARRKQLAEEDNNSSFPPLPHSRMGNR